VQPGEDVLQLLDQAAAEYLGFPGVHSADEAPLARQAGLARIALARGKYYFLHKENAEAEKALQLAKRLLNQLRDKNKHHPEDLYRLALADTLLGQVRGADQLIRSEDLTLDTLEAAVRIGFRHLERLKRDHSFTPLQQAQPERFKKIINDIEKERRQR
jgi:hypothetical protein